MKRMVSLLLILALIVSLSAVASVSGAEAVVIGDADGDGEVTILDATRIQRHLSDIGEPIREPYLKAAVVSGDVELSIVDVTLIQRLLAGIIDRFPAEETTPATQPSADTLVVVFSRTGNTKPLAQYAADYLNADFFEIEAAVPYTDADIAYYTDCRADREQRDPDARPAIAGAVAQMDSYQTVVIAYPIWHGQAPKIIYTFLESYDFTGKTIIPFCTSASSPLGTSASNLHALAPNAVWKDGRRFAAGTSQAVIEAWLGSMGY